MTSKHHSPLTEAVSNRIYSALAANAFGQAVTVGSQLILTPLFFRSWGAEKYGEWLLISSIPAYLSMADLGVGAAAGNEMTMKAGAGDKLGARQTFYSALWVASAAAGVSALIGAISSIIVLSYSIPKTIAINSQEAAAVLMAFSVMVALGFFGGVLSAGYRCCQRNAQGTALANTSRLFEAIAMCLTLFLGEGALAVCLSALLVKLLFIAVQATHLRLVCPWLFGHRIGVDRQLVKRLVKPSLGFLAFPLGNALALQGPIIILGWAFGGTAVALYSSLRTLARVPTQITSAFNASIWPELSLAYGAGNTGLLQSLHRRSWTWTLALSFLAAVLLLSFGQQITSLWLGPQGKFDALMFSVLILASAISAVWNVSAVVLTAINAHMRLGAVYVLTNLLLVGIAALLTPRVGWPALFSMLVAAELVLLIWVFPRTIKVTCDSYREFFAAASQYAFGRAPHRI